MNPNRPTCVSSHKCPFWKALKQTEKGHGYLKVCCFNFLIGCPCCPWSDLNFWQMTFVFWSPSNNTMTGNLVLLTKERFAASFVPKTHAWAWNKLKCPAWGKTCLSCGMQNHFARGGGGGIGRVTFASLVVAKSYPPKRYIIGLILKNHASIWDGIKKKSLSPRNDPRVRCKARIWRIFDANNACHVAPQMEECVTSSKNVSVVKASCHGDN